MTPIFLMWLLTMILTVPHPEVPYGTFLIANLAFILSAIWDFTLFSIISKK